MYSHQDAAHGQQEHSACLRSHRTKYEYRNIKNKWVNRVVSDDHQGSTTQEKSSALKKTSCSLLVSVFDWQLLGYGKNHTTEEMTVILFDWSSIPPAKMFFLAVYLLESVRAFVSFHTFCWFCWPPSSLVEINWAAKERLQSQAIPRPWSTKENESVVTKMTEVQESFFFIILYCFNSHWKTYF